MSKRSVRWKKQGVLGDDATITAQNIIARNDNGVGRRVKQTSATPTGKATTKPMSLAKAARLANAIHKRKV